uniref:Spondin domain-containing protein n=1 Tax=Lotharella oceanica TaxID=641309 RepID=A0A7S2X9S6_9EUKA
MREERKRLSSMSCDTDAMYKVTFIGAWTAERHGAIDYPINAHFSPFVVGTHGDDFVAWRPDDTASPGVEKLAETGSTDTLVQEFEKGTDVCDYTTSKDVSLEIPMNSSCSRMDFISALRPSPDWFTGLSDLDLCSEEGYWYHDVVIGVMPFSAGTADSEVELITELTPDNTTNPEQYFVKGGLVQPVAYITIEKMGSRPILGGGGSITAKNPSEVDCSTPVTYNIQWSNVWTMERHPVDYPPVEDFPHFSPFVYGAHDGSYQMWGNGRKATPGVQIVAEIGSPDTLLGELEENNPKCQKKASSQETTSMELTPECMLLSSISMIAPSPDWFAGFYNLNLCVGGKWLQNITVAATPWDAGTDCGITYKSPNCVEGGEAFSRIFEFTPEFPNPFVNDDEVKPVVEFTITMAPKS